MLAKIISAGALTLLLSGSALAYIPQQHNIYAGHKNGQQAQIIARETKVMTARELARARSASPRRLLPRAFTSKAVTVSRLLPITV